MIKRLFKKKIKCKECNCKFLEKEVEIRHIHDEQYPEEDYWVDWYVAKYPNCQKDVTVELYVKN